jgi:predicted transcriptional regulator
MLVAVLMRVVKRRHLESLYWPGTMNPDMGTVDASLSRLADRTAGQVVTMRGKELAADATVGDGRALLGSSSVRLIPVLDGTVYVGSFTRDDLDGAADDEPIAAYAKREAPTVTASTPLPDALTVFEPDGGRRVVVLGDDGVSYVGLLCLSRDRQSLCIDAECHAASVTDA